MTSSIPVETPNQIVPMILWQIKEHLETAMVLEVPETSPTRAVLVKVGRFQENPLEKNVSIAISGGDFEDPDYLDARVDNPDMEEFILRNIPVGEIGGGEFWWRRGTIRFQVYFVRQRYPEETAMQYAYEFYGRLLKQVKLADIDLPTDDFGEGAIPPIYVEGASFFESGGKDKFIWRGKLLWRVLTWRP